MSSPIPLYLGRAFEHPQWLRLRFPFALTAPINASADPGAERLAGGGEARG